MGRAPISRDRWRSLEGAAGSVDPDAAREFPPGVDEPPSDGSFGRREALRLLGASVMLAGAAGCSRAPRGKIVPYGLQPPEVTPGVAQHYATAMTLDGYATGLIVESHEGRPTKIEGNPDHPASLGATGVLEQASILSLYDPARAQGLFRRGSPDSGRRLTETLLAVKRANGRMDGLHLLLEPTSSPWIAGLLGELRALGAKTHHHSAVSRTAAWEGTRLVLGRALDPVLDLSRADAIVSLDADFLASGPFHCRYARQFADARRVRTSGDRMNRLYVVEPMLTVTGATADHRLRAKARDVATIGAALLREVCAVGDPPTWYRALSEPLGLWRETPDAAPWVRAVAKDLASRRGHSLVVAGESQPAVVHALAALLNFALGNLGETVTFVVPSILDAGSDAHGLEPLLADLDGGHVESLVILGGNPSYTAPADLEFARRARAAKRSFYLGAYDNETAKCCEWLVPGAHYLESWGDARALDGTVSIVQPLIAPLFGGRTVGEVLGILVGRGGTAGDVGLKDHWKRILPTFDATWPEALRKGLVSGTASPAEVPSIDPTELARLLGTRPRPTSGLELVLRADTKVHDGAFSNNAWLLELPDAMTKITWGNAALVSPATAARLGLATEDVVELSVASRRVRAPVFVMPGHADDSVALALGYGREGDETLGKVGVDAYRLRSAAEPFFSDGLVLAKTADKQPLATTQEHWSMEHRPIALEAKLEQYRAEPSAISGEQAPKRTLYQLRPDAPNQWALSIDLNACTGCNVCVVACQAENNVPIVGEEGVRKNREMHWLRLDRYFSGSMSDPQVDVEPMACQHCEKAPCEYVCPVGATVHSPDGLNEMVYNRCVGTRFCSNNCPYKVRRFNWFDYNRDKTEPERMLMNPDVTVRARGVMEKCSYCVQRIREAEIHSRILGTPIPDGGVKTACQQACPSNAIVFGSLGDPSSEVSRLHANERTYKVLGELGTEPRTRYMVRLRNPNPELER
jgi:Fe-S-cluster-containing dehydrogenase component/anaerobic selenocysteine-containing dehydrogenase